MQETISTISLKTKLKYDIALIIYYQSLNLDLNLKFLCEHQNMKRLVNQKKLMETISKQVKTDRND